MFTSFFWGLFLYKYMNKYMNIFYIAFILFHLIIIINIYFFKSTLNINSNNSKLSQ